MNMNWWKRSSGAATPADARACVLAAVDWACQRTGTLHIEVPGPHPCLTPLLEMRFHILYADIYMTSSQTPFFDPTCHVASGLSLF
jgi:hypothetical protein